MRKSKNYHPRPRKGFALSLPVEELVYPAYVIESPASITQSMYVVMPRRFKNAFNDMPIGHSALTASQLEIETKPNDYAWLMRIRLWSLVEETIKKGVALAINKNREYTNPSSVEIPFRQYIGTALNERSVTRAFKNVDGVLSWILCPLSSKSFQDQRLLSLAGDRLKEILSIRAIDREGNLCVDNKTLSLIARTSKIVQDRVLGKPMVRQESKHLHAHKQLPSEEAPRKLTAGEMDEQIKKLEAKAKGLPVKTHVIDAEEDDS